MNAALTWKDETSYVLQWIILGRSVVSVWQRWKFTSHRHDWCVRKLHCN